MSKCLIICHGYFGDHLFANSIAERLIQEKQFDQVDYVIGFPQVKPFFDRNPFVTNVILTTLGPSPIRPNNWQEYDSCFQLGPINRIVTPAVEMQSLCGVKNTTPHFYIHTNPDIDVELEETFRKTKEQTGLPVLAIMNGWKEKTFLFTREQYQRGIDVPNLGYGGSHRNTDYITEVLKETFPHVMVGTPFGVSQMNLNYTGPSLDMTASLLKFCDYFIGAEGGIANLAYAVGTKTIITSDFVHQLYGPNGVLQKLDNPQLGPINYTTNPKDHINLDPYLTDQEVLENIMEIILKERLHETIN